MRHGYRLINIYGSQIGSNRVPFDTTQRDKTEGCDYDYKWLLQFRTNTFRWYEKQNGNSLPPNISSSATAICTHSFQSSGWFCYRTKKHTPLRKSKEIKIWRMCGEKTAQYCLAVSPHPLLYSPHSRKFKRENLFLVLQTMHMQWPKNLFT